MNNIADLPITRAEALELLFCYWTPEHTAEWVPIQDSLNRITAKPVYSENSMPVFRTSLADGIAVRSKDFENGLPDTSRWVSGVEYAPADTGDDFPDDFDTIIPVESISFDQNDILHFSDGFSFEKGSRVRKAGSTVGKGDLITDAHVRVTPAHLSMLALGGIRQLEVIKKPRVLYIPTGSELINAGIKPERGQNIEANGLMVEAYLRLWGAEAVRWPIVKDDQSELEKALDVALSTADIVLINGGSSKGSEDFNAGMLRKRASVYRHGIRILPGKPIAVSVIGGKPVINMPGPTLATFIAMDWCVSGLIHHYFGLKPPKRPTVNVRLENQLKKPVDYEMAFRLKLTRHDGYFSALPIGREKTLPFSMLDADALFIAPIGAYGYKAGSEIEVELLRGIESI